MLLIGIFAGLVQGLILSGQATFGEGAARFAPGAIAALLIIWFFFQVISRGKFTLYPDRLEGKKKSGGAFTLEFQPGYQVDLASNSLKITDSQNKIVFLQPAPKPSKIRGLIWLQMTYPWAKEVLSEGILGAPDGHDNRFKSGLKRTFYPEGTGLFHDAGFIVKQGTTAWYLPWSDTYHIPGETEGKGSFRQAVTNQEPVLRFSPSPALLPLPELVKGLLDSNRTDSEKAIILEELTLAHGGIKLEEFNPEAKEWKGELGEIPLTIRTFSSTRNQGEN
jgi:hypothetical protein